MPDLPVRPRTSLAKARTRLGWGIDWVLANAGAAVLVGALAVILAVLRIEFQYVAGGFVIVFATRLASKRLYPEITLPDVGRPTPVRKALEKEKGPFEGLTQ